MKILGFDITKSAKKQSLKKTCEHTEYTYKYSPDNTDLYTCDRCGLVGRLVGGEQIPDSYNMITGDYAYKAQYFKALSLDNWDTPKKENSK